MSEATWRYFFFLGFWIGDKRKGCASVGSSLFFIVLNELVFYFSNFNTYY